MNEQYEQLLQRVLEQGEVRDDRTGTGTRSLFAQSLRFSLEGGVVPLITTKKVAWRLVVAELLWLISGSTNIKPLVDQDVHIWDEWADENGDLGPVYGQQWRSWPDYSGGEIDQLSRVIHDLRTNPHSRRHVVSAWNVGQLEDMALPPCHALFQFHVSQGRLSCQLYQRSADLFLGVPFNIASYALLTHLIAREVGLEPGEFIWVGGDCHIYTNHVEQVRTQIAREVRPFPRLRIEAPDETNIFALSTEQIGLDGYDPHPTIRGKVSV